MINSTFYQTQIDSFKDIEMKNFDLVIDETRADLLIDGTVFLKLFLQNSEALFSDEITN